MAGMYFNSNGSSGFFINGEDLPPLSKGVIIFIIALLIIAIIALPIVITSLENDYNVEHMRGVFQCPNCGSKETEGMYTFWYNNGMMCKGADEYVRKNADYSIFSCDYCDHDWKVFRTQWQSS